MKNLLLLTLSITLISCGNSGGNGSDNNAFNKYQDALKAQKAGLVMVMNYAGMDYDLDFDETTNQFSPIKTSFGGFDRSVVLKVEVYKYLENSWGGEEVVLESIALETKRTEEAMKQIDFRKQGDYLVGTLNTEAYEDEYERNGVRATISGGRRIFTIKLKSNNILCDFHTVSTTSGQIFTSEGVTSKLETVGDEVVGSCPASMTSAELKKIDLTKIDFCDQSKETDEDHCEEDKDMSFLTEEL
jgi:hypothetical protein